MNKLKILLVSMTYFTSALAQDDQLELLAQEPEEEEVRRYGVEIIVFSYDEDVAAGTEIFIPDPPPPEAELLFDAEGNLADLDGNLIDENGNLIDREGNLIDADGNLIDRQGNLIDEFGNPILAVVAEEPLPAEDVETAADGEELEDSEPGLVMFAEGDYSLTNIVDEFDRLDVYTTLLHAGWTQPTFPQEETLPLELIEFSDVPEGLEGSFTLYLSRYLHLVIDLALDEPDEAVEIIEFEEPFFSFGDARRQFDDEPIEPQRIRYRIQENRIVRNGDLRYFDHPKFGVLAKITRVEKEEAEPDVDEMAEPLLSGVGQ
jgi:hypothetical protein